DSLSDNTARSANSDGGSESSCPSGGLSLVALRQKYGGSLGRDHPGEVGAALRTVNVRRAPSAALEGPSGPCVGGLSGHSRTGRERGHDRRISSFAKTVRGGKVHGKVVKLFQAVAVAEALSWAGLLAGMFARSVLGLGDGGVRGLGGAAGQLAVRAVGAAHRQAGRPRGPEQSGRRAVRPDGVIVGSFVRTA